MVNYCNNNNNIHGRNLPFFISTLLVLIMIGSVESHTYLSSLIINGKPLAEGDGLRPHPDRNKEYPIADVSSRPYGLKSDDMICGWLPAAARPSNRKINIAAGTEIGMQWWHTSPGDEVMARTHKGPCTVWMAKSETGVGKVWFKIWQKGYDASRGRWCTDDMIDNRGKINGIRIPADIAPGKYLLRGEIIALHDGSKPGGAQPYVHCAELVVSGKGSANPPGVAIPGLYNDASLYIDLYSHYNSFTIPGPKVYVPGSSSTPKPSTSTSGSPSPVPAPPPKKPSSTRACRISISQLATDNWKEDGATTTQYNVVMTNSGASTVDLKFKLSAKPNQVWNAVSNGDGTYGLPSWVRGGLRPGQTFKWGYTVRGKTPLKVSVVVPSCDS